MSTRCEGVREEVEDRKGKIMNYGLFDVPPDNGVAERRSCGQDAPC